MFYAFGRNIVSLGGDFQNLPAVARNSQLLGNKVSDNSAAARILALNGNYLKLIHMILSLSFIALLYRIF